MAYAALVSLAQTIHKILHDHHRYFVNLHEKHQIISIHEYIIFLQAFLEDFPETANNLEGQIRDLANEAEDIIEDFMLEHIRQHCISKNQSVVSMCFKRKKRDHFYFQELEKVRGDIDSIAREMMEIKNGSVAREMMEIKNSVSCVATSSSPRPITASTHKDVAMVGFEDDLLEIKSRLCGESSKLEVVPIYGMGGIGKTTLARNAFVDQLIMEHFQVRAWVTVSLDYNASHILSSLAVSVRAERFKESDKLNMAEIVYRSLKGRRYLIVMDDMWNTKVWDDLRMILPNDNNGSRIILTTRLSDVAAYPDSSIPLHKMHFMDPDQSWNLLRQKVFKQEHCPLELENIGKEIARRCKGLPLAVVVIAGLLSMTETGKTQAYWEKIARSVNEIITENDEQFANIVLSLSYNHLPQHLKPCFLYMGSFPEDYEIRAPKLIKIYIAEGFLKLPDGSKSCEEAAEEYLEDLVKRSLVLVNARKSNGKIKSCRVHDLVRNLCIRKAQEEKFFLHLMNRHGLGILPENVKDARRLSIQSDIGMNFSLRKIYDPMHVHTVLYFERWGSLSGISESFRLLRVLDAVGIRFKEFPTEVVELFHLRYLAFTYRAIINFHVPASILKLENLQTLVICPYYKAGKYHMSNGVCLPSEIWRMSQLRHILVSNLDPLPYPDHALENLQKLARVTNFQCTKRMVKMIPNLKKLGILYSECGIKWLDYQLHNLVHMHQLEELKIWVRDQGDLVCFWKNLAFPRMLKMLNLSGFQFGWQDIATVGSLPNLEVLKLRLFSFEEGEWITSEGEFCQLKFLRIEHGYLQHWITENSHFPRLTCLVIHSCSPLDEIPDGIGEIPTLELIEVDDRNESLVESAKRIQGEQQSLGNDAFQVHVMHRYTNA